MSWFSPVTQSLGLRMPRRLPIKAIPSLIGESGQIHNHPFYEGGGIVAKDISPNRNRGLIIGGVQWFDGRWGWALEFDGATGYISTPASATMNYAGGGAPISLFAWIYPHSVAGPSYDIYSTVGVYTIRFFPSPALLAVQFNGFGDLGANCVANIWQHVGFVFDGVNLTIYQNAVQTFGPAPPVGGAPAAHAGAWDIGRSGVAGTWFDGLICLVHRYNVAKSAAWTQSYFNKTRSIFGV